MTLLKILGSISLLAFSLAYIISAKQVRKEQRGGSSIDFKNDHRL